MFMAVKKTFGNLFGLIKEKKSVPPVDAVSELPRNGIPKAYIPKFLYKPPFGYPRFVDLPNIRRLASMPTVEMCITTIVDEISAIPWDIVLDDKLEPTAKTDQQIRHVRQFFENPNTNKESFEQIIRKVVRDILEIDAGLINKVFNKRGEMVEIIARDGCLPYNSYIETDKGIKRIGEIVKNRLKVNVKSYNIKENKIEYKPIVNWFKNGTTTEWLKINTFTNTKHRNLTCTPNHKIYTKEGYKLAGELSVGDILYTTQKKEGAGEKVKETEIKSIEKVERYDTKYDIEVQDNHNYFAHGKLISNSTFTKNPDIFGMMTNREDIIFAPNIVYPREVGKLKVAGGMMEPGWITAADAREKAAYFQYGWITGARPVPFGKREIIWFERNPRTDSIYGRSPVEVLADTIQTLIYAIEHNLEYFNDNSIPKGIIGLEGSDADEIKAFKDQWMEQQRKRDKAGQWKKVFHHIPIVGKMPKFERLQFTNAELELLEGQKWWSKMVWASFGVTPSELGYTENSNKATEIIQSSVFRRKAINPILRLLEYKINHEIISEFQYEGIKFKFLIFDTEEEKKKYELYKIQIDSGIKTVNEIRAEEGLEKVEWGDKPPKNWQTPQSSFSFGGGFPPRVPTLPEEEERQEESTESAKKEKKAIELKPFGKYANFADCVRDNRDKKNPEAYCAALHKKITGKWPTEKALATTQNGEKNPLILEEFEVPTSDRLLRSIKYLLKQNEKKIKELLEKEAGKETLVKIKSIDDIAKAIKNIVTFEGLRTISDAVIRHTFVVGWDKAEKQVDKRLMMNKDAIKYIQDYTFNNIVGMTNEIVDDLRQELERGIMAGEGIGKLKKRVSKVFDVGENRAEMIARTETARAEGAGMNLAIKQSGGKFKKKVIATIDGRTSELCKRLNGQTVGLYEKFKDSVTGQEWEHEPFHVDCRSKVIYIPETE